jgi:hypothetical protein
MSACTWARTCWSLNFAERRTDPARFYTPDAYRRLRVLKAAIDPHDVMRANHRIPPAW